MFLKSFKAWHIVTAADIFIQDNQGGQIGLVVDCEWSEASSNKTEDKAAASRRLEFQLGW